MQKATFLYFCSNMQDSKGLNCKADKICGSQSCHSTYWNQQDDGSLFHHYFSHSREITRLTKWKLCSIIIWAIQDKSPDWQNGINVPSLPELSKRNHPTDYLGHSSKIPRLSEWNISSIIIWVVQEILPDWQNWMLIPSLSESSKRIHHNSNPCLFGSSTPNSRISTVPSLWRSIHDKLCRSGQNTIGDILDTAQDLAWPHALHHFHQEVGCRPSHCHVLVTGKKNAQSVHLVCLGKVVPAKSHLPEDTLKLESAPSRFCTASQLWNLNFQGTFYKK